LKSEDYLPLRDDMTTPREPLDDACRTKCSGCGATVWLYYTAERNHILLDNAPGAWVIYHDEALVSTGNAGYRIHRHSRTRPDESSRSSAVTEEEFLWV
jgi:hypothetical protein